MNRRYKLLIYQCLFFGIVLILWQLFGDSSVKRHFLFGTPSAIYNEFKKLVVDEKLFYHFMITGGEALSGIILGTTLGSFFGLLLWYSKKMTDFLRPFIIAVSTLPIFAFAPLLIIWFGVGFGMKVALGTLSTIFIAFSQANKGAESVTTEYVDALKSMNATKSQIFRKVIIPGSIDWVFNSMRLNVGFGLLGAFIGEFISAESGLGYLILRAAGLYNTPRAMAAAIGIILLALIFDFGARWIEKNSYRIVQFISVPKILR
jgi:NitT/TauT family transport system permease protein